MPLDGFAAGQTGVGNLPEGFPGIHIGDVNLHSRNADSLQGVQNGNGGVGVGCGIDDNAVYLPVSPLDFIHQISLVVGLVLLNLNAQLPGGVFQQVEKVYEGAFSIDSRFPNPQHIEIRAVDNQNFHFVSSRISRICPAVSSAAPSLHTMLSEKA